MSSKLKENIKTIIPNKILEIIPQIKLVGLYELFIKRHKRRKEILEKDPKLKEELKKDDSINVVIGIKNKYDHKIENSVKSIKNQDYPSNLIKITIVDYDSKKEQSKKIKKLCKKENLEYIEVRNKPKWSRSHSLNVGIKNSNSKYILASDTDIIFEKDYFRKAVKELKENPFQVIVNKKLKLPKNSPSYTINNYEELKKLAKPTDKTPYHQSMPLTLTYYYKKIRGFDESFKLWRGQDDDLIKRFLLLGLKIKPLSKKTSYLHQWHPRYQGKNIKDTEIKEQIKKNKERLKKEKSIIRNKEEWGEK